MHQYHGCGCHGSLRRHGIHSLVIDAYSSFLYILKIRFKLTPFLTPLGNNFKRLIYLAHYNTIAVVAMSQGINSNGIDCEAFRYNTEVKVF